MYSTAKQQWAHVSRRVNSYGYCNFGWCGRDRWVGRGRSGRGCACGVSVATVRPTGYIGHCPRAPPCAPLARRGAPARSRSRGRYIVTYPTLTRYRFSRLRFTGPFTYPTSQPAREDQRVHVPRDELRDAEGGRDDQRADAEGRHGGRARAHRDTWRPDDLSPKKRAIASRAACV